jgi:AraC family transcriptional activator of pobA
MSKRLVTNITDFDAELKLKGFKANELKSESCIVRTYNRKDFYKICLVAGNSTIHYADRGIEIQGPTLFFGNPHIPYSWEIISKEQAGYSCLFSEDFLKGHERSDSLQESPLFKIGGTPIFFLNNEQKAFITSLFQRMIAEQSTDYVYKKDIIRNYINLLIHEALKMQPTENYIKSQNAPSRITSLFLELLEKQFPIESTEQPLQLKSAQDFSKYLSVHVNHLNRSVKEITGKTTTVHIAERIIAEAKALLQHTDWNISEIAFALGFEYPTYFHNYFKRMTGTAPSSIRTSIA